MSARKQNLDEGDKEVMLVRAAAELLRLSTLANCAVLVTNQVGVLWVYVYVCVCVCVNVCAVGS